MYQRQQGMPVRSQQGGPRQISYAQLKLENAAMRAELARLSAREQEHAEQLARLFAGKEPINVAG